MSNFWLGFTTLLCYNGFLQDLLGKEKYLKSVDASWVNTPIWIWPLIMVVAIGLSVAADKVGKRT